MIGLLPLLLLLCTGAPEMKQPPRSPGVNGARAVKHVEALVRLGARVPGSPAHRQAQRYLVRALQQASLEVEEVDFVARTPRGAVRMKNIIGKIPGHSDEIVVLAGHYDTLDRVGFVGANDGGSSAALLLELARTLGERRPNPLTVWLAFFDGEEAVKEWSERDGLYGSRHQAAAWQRAGLLSRMRAVVVVDMIGDRDLHLRRELHSTPWLVDLVWEVARERGYQREFGPESVEVLDDHIPFLRARVPAVNLIDFDYGPGNSYWHTSEDTLDKLSPRSFEIVGEVVLATLDRLSRRWPSASGPALPAPAREPGR